MLTSLPVINLETATFECTFGRGCEGICCKNGRPSVYPEERAVISKALKKVLPHLRPEARAVVETEGYYTRRLKFGGLMVRVVEGWCIFFNEGCVLHKVGAAEGDAYRYKPSQCALFPLAKDDHDQWFVRQHGLKNEPWDIFCLDPANSTVLAADSLQDEISLAQRCDEQEAEAKARTAKKPKKKRKPASC